MVWMPNMSPIKNTLPILLTFPDFSFNSGQVVFLSGFSFTGTDDSQLSVGREETNLIPLYNFHSPKHLEIYSYVCN